MAILRGALIGAGFFAQNHLQAWRDLDGVTLVSVCDLDPARLAQALADFGIESGYEDAERMFAEQKLDFVDIATTLPSHKALVALAARHGVPVICQKPFAATLDDAREMVTRAGEAGIALMVHENFRWQTSIRAVRQTLDSGVIGQPFWARLSFRSAFDVYTNQPYLAEGERFIIEDLGIHVLDMARFLLGEVAWLSARTQRVNPRIKGEDVATILMAHGSGATSIVDCSYASRLEHEVFPQTLIEIEGSTGSLRLGRDYHLSVTTAEGTTSRTVEPDLLPWAERPWFNIQESVLNIQRHWVQCLRNGAVPETSGQDNLRTLALVEAAYRSAASGITVIPDMK